jgi:predicted nucleic acid-binding protein
MSGARAVVLSVVLAIVVAVVEQGLVKLVDASGAKDQPAVILVLLLAAFLGLLTAIATRALRVPGAVAPTVLVVGWILIPPVMGAIPSAATQLVAGKAGLSTTDAIALAVAVIAAAATLGVSAESR